MLPIRTHSNTIVLSKHIQSSEAISNPCCASMCLNRFTPENRLKPWIKWTVQPWIFHQAEEELTTLPGLRYSSGHRKGRLKILYIKSYPPSESGRQDKRAWPFGLPAP